MSLESAIYSILSSDGTLGDALASATSIYPVELKQDASLPAVVYQQISGPRDHTIDGASGLVEARVQITCWAATPLLTRTVADAVRGALDGYDGTSGGTRIECIQSENEIDVPHIAADNEQQKRYGKAIDFIVWFNE